jgi:hypothetical protein
MWVKRREAPGVDHKRLLYCVNVKRTSLDHLLLGVGADIDEMSHGPSITPETAERVEGALSRRRWTTVIRRRMTLPARTLEGFGVRELF